VSHHHTQSGHIVSSPFHANYKSPSKKGTPGWSFLIETSETYKELPMFVNDGGTMRPLKGDRYPLDDETLEMLQKTNDISPIKVLISGTVLGRQRYTYVVWYHIIDDELVVHYVPNTHRFVYDYITTVVIGNQLYCIEFKKDDTPPLEITKHTLAHYYVYSIVYSGDGDVIALTEEGQTMRIHMSRGRIKEKPKDMPELRVLHEHNIDSSQWGCCSSDYHIIKSVAHTISSQELPVIACNVFLNCFVIATDAGISSYIVDRNRVDVRLNYYYPTTSLVTQLGGNLVKCEDGSVWKHGISSNGDPEFTKIDQCEPSHSVMPSRKQPLPC
jgi:hypothetical protein